MNKREGGQLDQKGFSNLNKTGLKIFLNSFLSKQFHYTLHQERKLIVNEHLWETLLVRGCLGGHEHDKGNVDVERTRRY